MSVATHPEPSGNADSHIGPAHHRKRNLGVAIGTLAVAALMTLFYVYWGRHDVTEGHRLEQFLAAYSQKCDPAAFTTPKQIRSAYLASSTLQAAVDSQLAALEGGAGCAQVYRALRAADFPVPPLTAAADKTPEITVDPGAPEAP